MNNKNANYLLAVGGGYLLYLAFKLVISYMKGEASLGIFNVLIAVLFAAAGIYILIREWKNYRGSKKEAAVEEDKQDDK